MDETAMRDYLSIALYEARIRRDHKTRAVRAAFSLYAWLWFHTEFWIKNPLNRRPYTFIMRDWIYPHMSWFLTICGVYLGGLITWIVFSIINGNVGSGVGCIIVTIFSSMLWAHLCWAGGWKQGEQEWPPYLG